jgi:hypothetical protein
MSDRNRTREHIARAARIMAASKWFVEAPTKPTGSLTAGMVNRDVGKRRPLGRV